MLGGAAVHRCGNCLALNSTLAAEGTALDQELLFPQAVQHCDNSLVFPIRLQSLRSRITGRGSTCGDLHLIRLHYSPGVSCFCMKPGLDPGNTEAETARQCRP